MKTQLFFQTFIIGGLMGIGLSATGVSNEVRLQTGVIPADVAVSIIDNKLANADKQNTILTSLLLDSELKGAVEDAGWYFSGDDERQRRIGMDALMLTQGWSRYDVPQVLKREFSEPNSELEIGPSISGIVKSRWKGKPIENALVLAFAPSLAYVGEALTDKDGIFCFTEKDFPDGTKFIFQALNQKGDNEGNFDIIPPSYPSTSPLDSYAHFDRPLKQDDNEDELDYSWRINHSDGLMNIMLGEVMVVQIKPNNLESSVDMLATKAIDYKEIEKEHYTSFEEMIRKMPGVIIRNGQVTYRNALVEFWVDNAPWSLSGGNTSVLGFGGNNTPLLFQRQVLGPVMIPDLSGGVLNNSLHELESTFPIDFIKKIQFIPPHNSLMFSNSAAMNGGVIHITTKDGSELTNKLDWRFQTATPLGYQRSKEFYTPKYELMADYELNNRPTLYWIPRAEFDSQGQMTLTLPASVKDYTVTVEGIDSNGCPLNITHSFESK